MKKLPQADIGIFGGSGFYSFLNGEEVKLKTDYGNPSDVITIAEVEGKKVAFVPRHGKKHTLAPHNINYQANLAAFKKLGVKKIIAPFAAGSLQPGIEPGDFVVVDQFVDRTKKRKDSYFDQEKIMHISASDPYCPTLRPIAIEACRESGVRVHDRGTVVIVEGPRFSSKAESQWFTSHGWEVINMTQYPENILARELEMCYVGIALITDYDAGIVVDTEPVAAEEVKKIFAENLDRVQSVITNIIKNINTESKCSCHNALEGALGS